MPHRKFFAPSVDTETGVMAHMNPMHPVYRSQMLPSDIFTPVTDVDASYGHNPTGEQLNGVGDMLSVFSALDFLFPGN